MSRNANVTLGIFLVVIGLGVTCLSYSAASSGGGHYVVAWGAVLVGIVRIVRGLATPEAPRHPDREDFEQSLGRSGPSLGAQAVGQKCVHCLEKIVTASSGELCSQCNEPLHVDCRAGHRRDVHARRRRDRKEPAAQDASDD